MRLSDKTPWMTILMAVLVLLFAAVGGVVAIVNSESLSFQEYLDRLGKLALAVAGLGVGRSVRKGLTGQAPPAAAIPGLVPRVSLNDRPLMTITLGLLVVIAAGVGGAIVIADPETLDFDTYLDKMTTFAFAVGLQGAGRALRNGMQRRGVMNPGAPGPVVAGEYSAHPDHPANPTNLGVAAPEMTDPLSGGAALDATLAGGVPGYAGTDAAIDELSFLDPADEAALDDDLGADDEPEAGLADEAAEDPETEGYDDDQLPSDDEEEGAPPLTADELAESFPPYADTDLLDEPDEPNARMPSQEQPEVAQ
jgi:hypothetical protein